ncbi:MAG: hypothetical protein ACHQ7N_20295, partial [Candidatus Methylomirabilales bacterium]
LTPPATLPSDSHAEWLICTCCGRNLRNTPEDNCVHGQVPYPFDPGYGMCRGCGGDPQAASTRERLGWAATAFYDARIPLVADRLTPKNREKFLAMRYEKQFVVIGTLIERGAMM